MRKSVAEYEVEPGVRPALRAALGWEDGTIVISTRAWHTGYHPEHIVEAFAIAYRGNPRLRLLLVGDGEEADRVRARIASLGVGRHVRTPGMLGFTALKDHLAAADIYASVVPSDGTSISLLEAMRFRLPVVVVDNPGNREWVTSGENGYLVPAGDVEQMAGRIGHLATDQAHARRMGEDGLQRVTSRADWAENAPRFLALQETIVQRGHRHE